MNALVLKELRQLLPIAWLWIAILVFSYLTRVFTERIDEETFASWCEGYCEAGSQPMLAALAIIFTLVTAYSLFPREHDESTIDFLRALPLSRWQIHAGKFLAGWLLMIGINVLSYGIDALLLASNPESLGGRFMTQVWWTLLWRDCVFAFVILSHGIILSWFRTTGLVVYALYVILLLWYESSSGSAGLFSVFGMLTNAYDGQRLVVDARAIGVHVVIAVVLLFVGYRLWSRTESATVSGNVAGERSRRGTLVPIATGIAAFVLLIMFNLYRVGTGSGMVAEEGLVQTATDQYRFVYRTEDKETVDYLLTHADADFAEVGRWLGIDELPLVRVDLSAASEHAAGLAKWKKIRMDLNSFEADVSQRRVLAHEATHVLQALESKRALTRHFAAAQFFIEGMAQHVSFEVVPEPARRASNHALAAVAQTRHEIRFEDLVDGQEFARRFDAELYYSLGDLWSLALVETCGDDILGDFLRAAARDDAPREMSADRFWRDTFRETGCDLDTVNSNWYTRVKGVLETVDQARFPRFGEVSIRRDAAAGMLVIEADLVPAGAGERSSDETGAGAGDGASERSGEPTGERTGKRTGERTGEYSGGEKVAGIIAPRRVVVRIGDEDRIAGGVDPSFRGELSTTDGRSVARFTIPENAISRELFRYQLGYQPTQEGEGSSGSRLYYDVWNEGSAPLR